MVNDAFACPAIRDTTNTGTPARSHVLIAKCRSACSVTPSKPSRSSRRVPSVAPPVPELFQQLSPLEPHVAYPGQSHAHEQDDQDDDADNGERVGGEHWPSVDICERSHECGAATDGARTSEEGDEMEAEVAVALLDATGRKLSTSVRCVGYAILIQELGWDASANR